MPLRGMDFSRSNQAISRFNQFLQYDLLDQMRSNRDVDVMKIQDRLMRERQVEAGEIDKGVALYKSALTDREAYTKAWIDLSAKPEMEADHTLAMLGMNPNLPPEFYPQARAAAKRWAAAILPVARAHYNVSRGEGTKEDFEALTKFGGYKGSEEGMKETGTNIRARMTAETARGEQAVGRERIAAEGAGRTQAQQDKITDRYLKWIDDTTQFLVGEGVQGEAVVDPIYYEAKTRDPLTSEYRGQTLTYLQQLRAKVMRGGPDTLTDGNVSFITKVWNTPAIQGYVSDKLTKTEGGMGGPSGGTKGKGAAAPAAVTRRGGVPSPETGTRPAEYDQALSSVRQTWINQKAEEFIKAVYGETPPTPEIQQEAMKYATEYVDTRIMPSLMKR